MIMWVLLMLASDPAQVMPPMIFDTQAECETERQNLLNIVNKTEPDRKDTPKLFCAQGLRVPLKSQ